MIVVDDEDRLRIVTQPDHARFAGELLSLWRTEGLPDHPRRAELLLAVREHDNGWHEADAAPWVDPERHRPFDFLTYPDEERHEIWHRGIDRLADRHPYATLLIAEHAEALHRLETSGWQRLQARLEERRPVWLRQAGADRHEIRADYRFLRLADSLSLAVCNRWSEPFEIAGVTARVDSECLHLEPFPLAGATSFEIPVRDIPAGPYLRDTELGSELARARWNRFRVRVVPD